MEIAGDSVVSKDVFSLILGNEVDDFDGFILSVGDVTSCLTGRSSSFFDFFDAKRNVIFAMSGNSTLQDRCLFPARICCKSKLMHNVYG